MEDKEAAETLKNVEKIQSQVLKIEEQKKKKAKEGEDTSEEEESINNFFNQIHKIKFEFKQKSQLKLERFRKTTKRDRDDGDDRNKGYNIVDTITEKEEDKEEKEDEKEEDKIKKEEDKEEKEDEKEEDKIKKG